MRILLLVFLFCLAAAAEESTAGKFSLSSGRLKQAATLIQVIARGLEVSADEPAGAISFQKFGHAAAQVVFPSRDREGAMARLTGIARPTANRGWS